MQSALEVFGIRQGSDVQHKLLADLKQFEPNKYFNKAKSLLTQITPTIFEEVIPKLEEYAGKWNPGGFMVFPLGLIEDGSSLRLHVSAAGMPRDVLNGPFVHNHGWHLISKVLAGTYSDSVIDIQAEPSAIATDPSNGLLRLYETRRTNDGHDELVTDGSIVKATVAMDRKIHAGEFHTIEGIKIFHIPTTPPDQLAATLVLDSPAFTNTTYVLLDNSEPVTINRERIPLKTNDIMIAKEQLLNIDYS